MDIKKIEDANQIFHSKINIPGRIPGKRCIFFKNEKCCAPKILFNCCRTCFRISPQFALLNLFQKIKDLALQILTPQATPPAPPPAM